MQARIDYPKIRPGAAQGRSSISKKNLAGSGLDHKLLPLIKMRASQINGCAFCLDKHSIDARAGGETEQRLYTLNAWRETPFFSDRERPALAWTEAATNVSETHVPDEIFAEVAKHFNEKELVDLTLAVAMINLWNRVAISLRSVPGHYRPATLRAQSAS